MSYNIDESSSSSASSDAGGGWGGVEEVRGDEEEQRVLFQALDSFKYVSPVSRSSLSINSSIGYISKLDWPCLLGARCVVLGLFDKQLNITGSPSADCVRIANIPRLPTITQRI